MGAKPLLLAGLAILGVQARPLPVDVHLLSSHPTAKLAAAQLRRYMLELQLTTASNIISSNASDCGTGRRILLAAVEDVSSCAVPSPCMPSATKDSFMLCKHSSDFTSIIGSTNFGVLNGVHSYLEAHGVRFSLEGPLLPTPARAALQAPQVGFVYGSEPVFTQRGLQPFHDFFSGPDWWNEGKYKAVAENLMTMKANQLALHTYPYSASSPVTTTGVNEPTVWVGTVDQLNADGTVNSAYPVSWANTQRVQWGMTAMNTSDPLYQGVGAQAMYDCDCFGHALQACNPHFCPAALTNDTAVALFNAVGSMWTSFFPYAHALGVGTTVGTEMPLSMPPDPNVMVPLNLYYSQSRNDHFATASGGPGQDCNECMGLYTYVATIGYVYAAANPQVGATLALNTYYGNNDNVLAPTSPGPDYTLVRTECYVWPTAQGSGSQALLQYVHTWEDGSTVDHWALAGTAMQQQAQAAGYSLQGTLGYIAAASSGPSAPTVQDYYEGILTRLNRIIGPSCVDNTTGQSNGMCTYWVWTPEWFEWQKVNITNPLIQQVVNDTLALHAARDKLQVPFNLATCGWVVGPLGARWYMDTVLAPDWTISSIDMQVGNTPVDPAYANITHHAKTVIPWAEDDPGLTAPELWLNRTLAHARDAQAYGASGLLIIHWRTRVIDPQVSTGLAYAWNTSLTTPDAWDSWCLAQFGPTAASQASAIFQSIDSFNTPRPVAWITGPGNVQPDTANCNWNSLYAFVDAFAVLRTLVLQDIIAGQADDWALERFDYWVKSFSYMRGLARVSCDWANYNAVINGIGNITDPTQRQTAAQTAGYAARASLISNTTRLLWDQLAEVTSPGEMGVFSNLLQHSLYAAIGAAPTAALAALAGVNELPSTDKSLFLPGTFDPAQPPLLRVPVRRTMQAPNEPFHTKGFILSGPSNLPPINVTLWTAPMGTAAATGGTLEGYTATPMVRVTDGADRWVYDTLPPLPPFSADFEWYISAMLPSTGQEEWRAALPSAGLVDNVGQGTITLNYPPTAPAKPQTVVIVPM